MSFLSGILNAINPANIVKGLVATGTGLLDNISKGRPIDISGNLSKGIKEAFSPEIDSTNAANVLAGSRSGKTVTDEDDKNVANIMNSARVPNINKVLGSGSNIGERELIKDAPGGFPAQSNRITENQQEPMKIVLPKETFKRKGKKKAKKKKRN